MYSRSCGLLILMVLFFHSAGETTYNLDTAGGLRMEVQKYYELIDALRYMLGLAHWSLKNIHFFCHI